MARGILCPILNENLRMPMPMTPLPPKTEAPPLTVDADLLCGHCGQNLRGVASGRCPECGRRFDRARILTAVIPWEQRRQIGRFKAYWRTAHLITLRGPAITDGAEMTLRSARSFRRWTLLMVCLTVIAPILVWKLNDSGNRSASRSLFNIQVPGPSELSQIFRNSWFFGTSMVVLCLWIIAAIGISDWFFQSRRFSPAEQSRALARSCYSIAPLASMPVFALPAFLFLSVELSYDHVPVVFYPAALVFGTMTVLCGLCPLVYGWGVLRLLYSITQSRFRMIAALVLLPILWTLMAGLIFFGLQFAVNYFVFFFLMFQQ